MGMFRHDGSRNSLLWGLVLAAGDGQRLQSYVEKIRGDALPKQYVNFVGRRSMLEHTFDRAEKAISPRQIVTVVGKQHLQYKAVQRQLARQLPANVIVQPENKETLPGILLPLMHVYKRCPDAIVVLFPSYHFILEEDRFMDHVAQAARAVAHDPSRVVLLAIESQHAEAELWLRRAAPKRRGLELLGHAPRSALCREAKRHDGPRAY
jgi:mannose-1-phosphate guanylyltransferase